MARLHLVMATSISLVEDAREEDAREDDIDQDNLHHTTCSHAQNDPTPALTLSH